MAQNRKTHNFIPVAVLLTIMASTPMLTFSHALHPESIDRCAELILTPSELVVIFQVILGINPTDQATEKLDADNDGKITDAERNRFVEEISGQYAARQRIRIGETELHLQSKLGDVYSTIGHNGINCLRIDIGFACPLPDEIPRDATLAFSYEDLNFKNNPGWKQITLAAQNGVRYEGHVPYQQYAPFDYEIINTKGFYPSTESLQIQVYISQSSQSEAYPVLLPEKTNIYQEKPTSGGEMIVMGCVFLFGVVAIAAIYFRIRR
ncbi:MAG: hypothetical protein C4527_14640 [Candidatus Omnitrophota bacterium]|jgi:hypothetical protein|nr:MAG: hypothetical protein C4527_14640 [Candidatus Omnitrophota bacterium]